MSPRDKALTEFLEQLAAYVVAPSYASYADREAMDRVQEVRAIRARVLLNAIVSDMRDPLFSRRSGPGSLASLLVRRLELLREYAAEPLPYEPFVSPEVQS